jgi:hypothetical protein
MQHMPMSLSHFTGFREYLNERQLASILGQGSSNICIIPAVWLIAADT